VVPATAAFDDDEDPMALKTGFFLGAPEVVVLSDIDWISLLLLEALLGLSWPPVSFVNCFISLRRCVVEEWWLVWVGLLVERGCVVLTSRGGVL